MDSEILPLAGVQKTVLTIQGTDTSRVKRRSAKLPGVLLVEQIHTATMTGGRTSGGKESVLKPGNEGGGGR